MCNIIAITWNALPDDPCPITMYMIDVNDAIIAVARGVTSFNYPLGDGSCGKTYSISVYAISVAGIGSKSIANQLIACAGKQTTVSVHVPDHAGSFSKHLVFICSGEHILFAVNLHVISVN